MRYVGMPAGMWALFAGSFQSKLTEVLGYTLASGGPYCDCGYKKRR